MPAPFDQTIIPAGATQVIAKGCYAWSCFGSGPGATWSENGGPARYLPIMPFPSNSDDVPWGDVTITSDPTIPTVIAFSRSQTQAKRLVEMGSPGAQSIASPTVNIAANGTPLGANGGGNSLSVLATNDGIVSRSASTGVVSNQGSATTTATNISGALTGGTGAKAGLVICNTSTTGILIVSVGAAANVVAQIQPNTCQKIDPSPDPSSLAVFVAASTGTVNYSATEFYQANP